VREGVPENSALEIILSSNENVESGKWVELYSKPPVYSNNPKYNQCVSIMRYWGESCSIFDEEKRDERKAAEFGLDEKLNENAPKNAFILTIDRRIAVSLNGLENAIKSGAIEPDESAVLITKIISEHLIAERKMGLTHELLSGSGSREHPYFLSSILLSDFEKKVSAEEVKEQYFNASERRISDNDAKFIISELMRGKVSYEMMLYSAREKIKSLFHEYKGIEISNEKADVLALMRSPNSKDAATRRIYAEAPELPTLLHRHWEIGQMYSLIKNCK